MIPIDDPDDPRIAAYRDVRERDLVGRQGLFVAEGEVVVRRLVASPRCAARSLLLAEGRIAAFADVRTEAPVYVASRAVMDAIVGFPIHRGVLAIGERPPEPSFDALTAGGAERLLVVLIGLGNHDNVGGVFRSAAAFGVDAVLLDQGCCDPLYRKAVRVSVGAVLDMPFLRFDRPDALIRRLEAAGYAVLALTPDGAATLDDRPRTHRTALLLGAEGPGLPAEIRSRVTGVRIPMTAGFDSLNVAVAGAIALHHLRQRSA